MQVMSYQLWVLVISGSQQPRITSHSALWRNRVPGSMLEGPAEHAVQLVSVPSTREAT
jgi:hypothetical protein